MDGRLPGKLGAAGVKQQTVTIAPGLEGSLRDFCTLLLQKTPVKFPIPTLGNLQPPVTSAPGNLAPYLVSLDIFTHVHVHKNTHKHLQIITSFFY